MLGLNECLDLPNHWKNRISSILSNKCLVLYTQPKCKSDKLKATLINNTVYFDADSQSSPSVPRYNFYGSM